ncbi:hypothetical protein CYMTET_3414 [Cymbomonas tetramitiformis]|uniref:CCHC-type domain-containing protein n=1 Tax=Cymbomonas tetramitiformis TaxID=36881 RepID=A0AAE0LL26_9CHLO|nr:hypothetical protein CYMTET_3414 [Cymbomonas tetramitiformis]
MDTLTDEALATRIEELRASEALRSFLEKLTGEGAVTFTAEETGANTRLSALTGEHDRRAVRAAHAQHLQQAAGGGGQTEALHAKLDELLAANGPPRRALPGATCDFKDKNGSDGNAAKRTWDFANAADKIFHKGKTELSKAAKTMPAPIAEEIKENLKKAEEALEEGMTLSEAKAQLALIAFKDGWNVAKKFADEPVTNSDEAEKRYKKAKKAASEEAAANADSRKARNGWKARGGWRPQQFYQPPPQPRNDFGPKGGKGKGGNGLPPVCFICGRSGHMQAQCPFGAKGN